MAAPQGTRPRRRAGQGSFGSLERHTQLFRSNYRVPSRSEAEGPHTKSWTKNSARVTADALDALGRTEEAKALRERYGVTVPQKPNSS
jgi:hypothetical protein